MNKELSPQPRQFQTTKPKYKYVFCSYINNLIFWRILISFFTQVYFLLVSRVQKIDSIT